MNTKLKAAYLALIILGSGNVGWNLNTALTKPPIIDPWETWETPDGRWKISEARLVGQSEGFKMALEAGASVFAFLGPLQVTNSATIKDCFFLSPDDGIHVSGTGQVLVTECSLWSGFGPGYAFRITP